MIGIEKYHFLDLPLFYIFSASILHWFNISFGISLTVIAISIGSNIKSSKYPKIGIKSGIKSIGDNASPTVIIANIFTIWTEPLKVEISKKDFYLL